MSSWYESMKIAKYLQNLLVGINRGVIAHDAVIINHPKEYQVLFAIVCNRF